MNPGDLLLIAAMVAIGIGTAVYWERQSTIMNDTQRWGVAVAIGIGATILSLVIVAGVIVYGLFYVLGSMSDA